MLESKNTKIFKLQLYLSNFIYNYKDNINISVFFNKMNQKINHKYYIIYLKENYGIFTKISRT
ncbi:hypothetical protein [Campylobacter phage CJLB-12]|nr:hypothetical protein [Campylobacter phage CJLB-12]